MTIEINLIVKHNGEYKLVEYGYIHNGSLNNFDYDETMKECIEDAKGYYKTDIVKLSSIQIK